MTADDRTPDTREVRSMYEAGSNLYRETPEQHYLGAPAPDYGAEFDRWLTAHDARVEHRATRAEAQSDIRGRAVVMYRERAREAEAERDEWRQTALDERGAALDALEQVKVRDARIKAVQDVHRHVTVETRGAVEAEHRCLDCCLRWPCPTIRAMEG